MTVTPLTHDMLDDIRRAISVLRQGGVILYPTDTVWGIGCDATLPEAVERVYHIKQRADAKALITLVDSEAKIEAYVADVPPVAWDLIDCATRPLTLIYDHPRYLASNLLASDGSAALRITREPFSRQLCMQLRRPLVSTSANLSGQPTPATFADISPEIISAVDYVCTSRRTDTTPHQPSTIIKLGDGGVFRIIRP